MLEYKAGNIGLARSMHSCAVKADPESDFAWEVSNLSLPRDPLCKLAALATKKSIARIHDRAHKICRSVHDKSHCKS